MRERRRGSSRQFRKDPPPWGGSGETSKHCQQTWPPNLLNLNLLNTWKNSQFFHDFFREKKDKVEAARNWNFSHQTRGTFFLFGIGRRKREDLFFLPFPLPLAAAVRRRPLKTLRKRAGFKQLYFSDGTKKTARYSILHASILFGYKNEAGNFEQLVKPFLLFFWGGGECLLSSSVQNPAVNQPRERRRNLPTLTHLDLPKKKFRNLRYFDPPPQPAPLGFFYVFLLFFYGVF